MNSLADELNDTHRVRRQLSCGGERQGLGVGRQERLSWGHDAPAES